MNGAAELTKGSFWKNPFRRSTAVDSSGERMDLDHILTLVDDAKRDANNLVKGFIAYDAVREWIVATSGSRTQASRSEPQSVVGTLCLNRCNRLVVVDASPKVLTGREE